MYPLGVLFGLGFDTSSEIAILGISSIQASKGTTIWLILIFPLLFTVGMCLLDTTDGAMMMTLYTSTQLARDPIAICYYSIVLTVITVVVATVIGVVQFLNLALNVAEPSGPFWDGVERLGEKWDIVGKCFYFESASISAKHHKLIYGRRSNMWRVCALWWSECHFVQTLETACGKGSASTGMFPAHAH